MSYWKPRGYTDKDGTYKRYVSSTPTHIRRDGYFYEDIFEEMINDETEKLITNICKTFKEEVGEEYHYWGINGDTWTPSTTKEQLTTNNKRTNKK
jgi:hypothetical protein|tara:strand:+ start:683 stop:967 length:285 start_codon:yes stop_codon:yes gene_type:complete